MGIFTDIRQLSQSEQFLFIPFAGGPNGRAMSNSETLDATPLPANNAYFQVWLERLSLGNVVGANQVAAVQAKVTTSAGNNDKTYARIIGPDKIPTGQLQQVLYLHEAITPLLPFEGGSIDLLAALYAVDGPVNQISPLLTFIGTVAGALMLPAVAAAVPIAQQIVGGLDTLHGAPGMHPKVAIDVTLDPNSNDKRLLVSRCYLAVIDRTRLPQAITPSALWVIDGQLQCGDPNIDPTQNPAMTAFDHTCPQCPYVLFSLESTKAREDWRELDDIRKALDAANNSADAAQKRQYKEAAIAAVKLSPAIAVGDRQRIIEQINREVL